MSTYTPIASITLASAASSVTFSGIPQTYTDLVVVANLTAGNTGDAYLRFNSDTGNNYSNTTLRGNGSAASSVRDTSVPGIDIGVTSSIAGSEIGTVMIQVQNYSNSTTNKTSLIRYSEATGWTAAIVGLWRNTNAISSLSIVSRAGDWGANSTFNLYGIANASITNVAKATGGDSVYTDGTYWYHIFRSSGTFTPTQALTADYLVVAGGGGGGNTYGGGGGAGGLRSTVTATGGGGSLESPLSLTAQSYTVTVGAGGAVNTNGNNSVFSTITSTGGGGGANGGGAVNGGGSGGGASYGTTNQTGGAGTSNQGYKGGDGAGADNSTNGNAGAGGGGAGSAGVNRPINTNDNGTDGGNGVSVSISGSSVTYAGGGGGGSGGYLKTPENTGGLGKAGGGNGGKRSAPAATSATANSGSGGGGGGTATGPGGSGGSGIVVIRYSAAA